MKIIKKIKEKLFRKKLKSLDESQLKSLTLDYLVEYHINESSFKKDDLFIIFEEFERRNINEQLRELYREFFESINSQRFRA